MKHAITFQSADYGYTRFIPDGAHFGVVEHFELLHRIASERVGRTIALYRETVRGPGTELYFRSSFSHLNTLGDSETVTLTEMEPSRPYLG